MSAQVHGLDVAPGLERVAKKLAGIPRGLDIVCARAVNKAAAGGRTDAVRLIAERYALKQKDVRESFKLPRRATYSDPTAVLSATGFRSVSLRKWSPTPQPGGKRPKGGLRVRILKAAGAKVAGGTFWMRASKGSGAHTVMKRAGKKRYPLAKVWGPTFMALYRKPESIARIKRSIAERLRTTLRQETRYLLLKGAPA